jgi:hypothetical protein
MAKFKIYGDYGYTTENLMEEFDTYEEARRWVDGYTRWGDFGGYDVIEIARFAEDGEYVIEYSVKVEDFDYADELYEGDDDFALMEDF